MLMLDRFPTNHVGVCTMCERSSNTASPPPHLQSRPLHARQDNVSEYEQLSQEQPPQHIRRGAQRRTTPCSTLVHSEPSGIHRQRNPHSVLPGSVTTYSDAGQYPSGRSTYGVTKPSQRGRRGRTKTSDLPVRTSNNLQDLRELFRSLSKTEYESFIRSLGREADVELPQSQLSQGMALDETPQSLSETEDEDSTAGITVYPVTSAVTRWTDEICELWDASDIADVFPKAIWPNPKTPWSIGVLREFRDMAQKYPSLDSRQGISTKFAELVQARRGRSNAKSQWSIVDARTTHAWAKEQYETESDPDTNEEDRGHANTTILRSSQALRLRKPLVRHTYSQKRSN
jgi:hypothetical protein